MHLSELKSQHVTQLVDLAVTNEIEGANRLRKQDLVFAILKNRAKKGDAIFEAVAFRRRDIDKRFSEGVADRLLGLRTELLTKLSRVD